MYNISIKHALIGVFALAFTAFAGFAYMGISGLRSLSAVTRDISSDALPAVQRSQDMALLIADLRVAYRDHVLAEDKSDLATTEKQIADLHAALDKDIDAYGPFASSDRERQLITEIRDTKQQYEASGPGLFAFSNTQDSEGARIYLAQTMKPMVKKIQAAAAELVALNKKSGEIDTIAAEQTEARVSTLMLGIAGAVFVFFAACALYAMRGISAPLVRLTGAMKNVASGETGITVPFADRRNEVGQMARALEIFREAAITNRRLEAEAAAARKQMEADRIAAQERAEADAAARLRVATSGLAGGLQRLASGDLAFQLDDAFAPDFEQLRHDFNASVQQLGETLVAVAASIGSLQNGTQEIAAGANDLSRRTEQQAASLEETAAALDQITVNVRNSTERTGEARAVAGHATTAADRSAEVVGQAESAMRRIEESSQQISNIIGVIDEIAFQTNLLALNAGVEAARAGEAGKGFAVVAQEVRELAQRAASAAKEIKGLISTSTTEVNTGVRLVRDAGDALKTIGHYITEMNAHMQAIATSAQEQSTGLAEVNIAVNQMDQTTQQNAAMVEQSTAAASSLASEAEKLKDMVNRFRLANARRAPAPVHRQPVSAAPVSQSRATPAFATAGATALAVNSWEEF